MSLKELHRLQKQMTLGKGVAKPADVDAFVKAAQAELNPETKTFLQDLLQRKGEFFDDAAYRKISELAGIAARPVLASGVVAGLIRGRMARSLEDDVVVLGADGTMSASAAITPYIRGYNQKSLEPLKVAHGSKPPPSQVAASLEDTPCEAPGPALDRMAKIFGAKVGGFEKMAASEWFSNPKAPHWWGTCDAWAWSALSQWINKRVDVDGTDGERGLWVAGQWMSRGDLGVWMMALADTIAVKENGVFFEEEPGPESMLKAALSFLDHNGGGLVGEMWNDKRHAKREVWNHPLAWAEITTETLESRGSERLLEFARAHGIEGATKAKFVKVAGDYAHERGEHWEWESPQPSRAIWNMYVLTDDAGRMIKAYYADDPAISEVRSLPVHDSAAPPDYIWKPSLDLIYDALYDEESYAIDSNPVGQEYRFFLKEVLAHGISGQTRTRFEAEVLQTTGPLNEERLKALAQAYPGIANAYSPEQWQRTFASRGMGAKAFGARWPSAR